MIKTSETAPETIVNFGESSQRALIAATIAILVFFGIDGVRDGLAESGPDPNISTEVSAPVSNKLGSVAVNNLP